MKSFLIGLVMWAVIIWGVFMVAAWRDDNEHRSPAEIQYEEEMDAQRRLGQ